MDKPTINFLIGVLTFLAISSVIGWLLNRRATETAKPVIQNLNARIKAWWIMVFIFAFALFTGKIGTILLFSLLSFLALREFITITPTKLADHRTLFWLFYIIIPIQYFLVAKEWYGLFAIMIPVYAFLFVPIRSVLAEDCTCFLERTAKIQWGLMIAVYCISYVPALLTLHIPGFKNQDAKLVLFLVTVAQISDVLQYVWGKTLGRHKIAPTVSPNKTWEGFIGGIISATLIGSALWWLTPFTPVQAGLLALSITILGFCGGLVMSAIKRDRGVKDFGNLIEGHGGILDRLDSICFAAPVFFHLVRFFYT